MYSIKPGLILAFHGCDRIIVDEVLSGKTTLQASKNKYDWLGHGIYFWENSPARAFEYATFLKENPSRSKTSIINPSVIGAILYLGNCLDLSDYADLELLRIGYELVAASYQEANLDIPLNRRTGTSEDILRRDVGFREKDHIQICIRNPNCIKGYFLPRKNNEKFSRV